MAKLISIGQIIDDTWENYTNNFKTWMAVSSLLFIISAVWILGSILSPGANTNFLIEQGLISPLQTFGLSLSAVASKILFPLVTFWLTIIFIKVIAELNNKKKINLKEILLFGVKKIMPTIAVFFLQTLIAASSLLAIVPGFVLTLINANINGGAVLGYFALFLTFVGEIVALGLLIFLAVTFAFSAYELLIGEKTIIESLKGSYTLVKGRFFEVILRYIAPKILITSVIIFLNLALTFILVLLFGRVLETQYFLQELSSILTNLSFSAVMVLTAPLWVIADYSVYDSLRKTK
ncbi:hypothetical protein COY25_01930 [Candidatus Uhrbacteria bacterium CG_4_10_14_0_2_um_filter_41_7]|uniref:Glycerophosphoryl diester phosphodiesterase membrane domain-containing protein n=1 Tax=Candidatus Uhrbacteria bacterium CG_4_9_14_3_um_filter_41_35 TaxID=1975034 RepID=A0A2M7XG84_9BACT|nr:MAG: hypothetical protein COV92_02940 [Candidatus Uhrbacteria bacterium CG11_big_fil_rev_8_21_14_0_20_41_9]PIZ54585.1 MAG: hypothetical protein COY25_01930 [Candidatus Uhrbacteria bacterium CG_4_10_14_0_2_um_filter_41_7]PJA46746.1 MAG: hypothetical protein CO173_01485 [Candidatus Uhrbacteria bacterium CG_4_9_14_3_um_filter_41_35]